MTPHPATSGVILAGGLARRMGGGDKPLLKLQGRTLLAHVAERLLPQCACVILNANGDPARFAGTGLAVAADSIPDHPGPLAGILAALEWTALHRPSIEWVVSTPGDTPFIPRDLVGRLHQARDGTRHRAVCAASGAHAHYATGLWPVGLRHDLRHAIESRGIRRMEDWVRPQGLGLAFWPDDPYDPFFNINTPEDLDAARALLNATPSASRKPASTGAEPGAIVIELNLSGLKCPLPALRTRKALTSMKPGDQLRVICTDPLAGIDVPNLVRELGDTLVEQVRDEKSISFLILRAGEQT